MTPFDRCVEILATIAVRRVDTSTVEARLFVAWLDVVGHALAIPLAVAQVRAMFRSTELDDHAMRLAVRELTEAARAVTVPDGVAGEWRGALDALAIVADKVCNDLPRRPTPVPTPNRGAN